MNVQISENEKWKRKKTFSLLRTEPNCKLPFSSHIWSLFIICKFGREICDFFCRVLFFKQWFVERVWTEHWNNMKLHFIRISILMRHYASIWITDDATVCFLEMHTDRHTNCNYLAYGLSCLSCVCFTQKWNPFSGKNITDACCLLLVSNNNNNK